MINREVVDFGEMPPLCTIEEYPPLAGETSREYTRRVKAIILCEMFTPKPSLWSRFLKMVRS